MPLLKPHKFAEFLPEMTAEEFAAMKDTVAAQGLLDPIVLYEGKILDGRHRYRACNELDVKPRTENFKGSDAQAVAFVYAKSTHRIMDQSQKACVTVLMLPYHEKQAKDRQFSGVSANGALRGKASEIAAQLYRLSPRLVEQAKQLYITDKHGFDDARAGRKSVHAALQASSKARRKKALASVKPLEIDEESLCLLEGDVTACLSSIAAKSVRCIFTDPPYDLGKSYHGDKTGDARGYEKFQAWCAEWIRPCAEALADDGSFFLMMNGRNAGGLCDLMRANALHFRNIIYWWENNPENQKGNFSDAVRQILYFTKTASKFIFHDDVRVPSRRNVIGDKRGIDGGKLPDNVWIDGRIPGNDLDRVPFEDAPPQLPIQIPQTAILVSTNPGDIVMDPFNGNGTTAVAALRNGRKYIGIDQSSKYLKQSRRWIAAQLAKKE